MSDVSIESLMAALSSDDSEETPETSETPVSVAEAEPEAPKVEAPEADEDPLAGHIVGATEEPKPAPKRRGRPKGSTNAKKKTAASQAETESSVTEATESEDTTPMALAPEQGTDTTTPSVDQNFTEAAHTVTATERTAAESKDIYILSDTQILNGHVYRRGQKITFRKGDKFYNSQTDRNGKNWLDFVDSPEAQYAYFGKLIVQPDVWTDTPIGSTSGINHPGLALALAKIAQDEFERDGRPFN